MARFVCIRLIEQGGIGRIEGEHFAHVGAPAGIIRARHHTRRCIDREGTADVYGVANIGAEIVPPRRLRIGIKTHVRIHA